MKCTLLDVGVCKSQMCLLTGYSYFIRLCFSSPCPTCFFTGRMNHVMKPVFLWQCWRWRIQHFSAHMTIFIRGWFTVIHTYVTSVALMTFTRSSYNVGVANVFCLWWVKWGVPAGSALLAAQTVLDTGLWYCSCPIHLNDPGAHRWKTARHFCLGGGGDRLLFWFF